MTSDDLVEVLDDMGYDYEYMDVVEIAFMRDASIAANMFSTGSWAAHIKPKGGVAISTRTVKDVFDLQDWLINEYERYLDKRR